jgi:hypothetical protein
MTARGLKPPHLLLASGNPVRMIHNISHLISKKQIGLLTAELDKNASELFSLGLGHFTFAATINDAEWRQKISRLYYAAYNVRRALALKDSGAFATDSSDHKNVDQLPQRMENREAHISKLRNLRDDRNLADYSHTAVIDDLLIPPGEAFQFVVQFIEDGRTFLTTHGVAV